MIFTAIPIAPVPSQLISVVLNGQPCKIKLYQKSTGVFLDLYVNDALIIGGTLCLHASKIVRSEYLGFVGELAMYDLEGSSDPEYTGFGSRYALYYVL